jgi:hypothetical protein
MEPPTDDDECFGGQHEDYRQSHRHSALHDGEEDHREPHRDGEPHVMRLLARLVRWVNELFYRYPPS